MDEPRKDAGWQDAPIVTIYRKVCPHCDGRNFIHVWSEKNGDGSATQSQICKRCSRRVRFVIEDPPSGESLTTWPIDSPA